TSDSWLQLRTLPPKKLWGCIAAPPRVPFRFTKEAYLFFLAFFFAAILFSSELFRFCRQRCWRSAYSIIMYRVTELSCQVESDVDDEKMKPEEDPLVTRCLLIQLWPVKRRVEAVPQAGDGNVPRLPGSHSR